MNAAELSRSVAAGKLPPLILLHGEEAFLLQEALTQVSNAAVAPVDRDFNLNQFSAQDNSVDEILEAAYSYPVFAPRRCVIVRQAHCFNATQHEQLLQYIKKPLDSTCLILCAEKIDKRKKFFTNFKKQGALVEFKRLFPDKIPSFVERRAAERGRRFTTDGLHLFCHRVGTNLSEVIAELEKLISYCGADETILDVADVAAVVSDTCLDSIFDLTAAVGSGDLRTASLLTERLQHDGEHPLKILTMLVRHFRQLWKIHALLEAKATQPEICKRAGIHPYFAGKTIAQARTFNAAAFVAIFELFVQLDMDLKSGGGEAGALMQQGVMRLVEFGGATAVRQEK